MNQQNNQPVRRSRRLATIIPASHWISIGYSEFDAQLMEKLQNDMKKCCDGSDDTIELKGCEPALPHHDMMLPHWKRFADEVSGHSNVDSIFIFDIGMPVSVLDMILPKLQMMNLKTLQLLGVNMGNKGLLRLAAFLGDHSSLSDFALGWDTIDESVATPLSDAVKNHPTLDQIGFAKCGLDNVAVLKIILEGCKTMKHLALTADNLGSEAVATITDFIRSNHHIERIMMKECNITDTEAILFASVLMQNTSLKSINLQNNNITEAGEKTLLKALFDPTSMDSIVESNHTSRVYTYECTSATARAQRPPLEQEVLRTNRKNKDISIERKISIQQKIRRKVVLALCGVDGGLFDLSHFNDLPLQLMPRVLELIQEHTKTRNERCSEMPEQLEKDALSRLFHTLKGWELPLLFENLRTQVPTGKRKRRKTCRYQ